METQYTMSNPLQQCQCGSGMLYEECCAPFHLFKQYPSTAEQLMRSRYCAYILKLIDYIIETTVPIQQIQLDKQSLFNWAQTTHWVKLEIIEHIAKIKPQHAIVEFKAYSQTAEGEQIHHERSAFVSINHRWYFLDPTIDNHLTLKQPCLCGSKKKFKLCCAPFLK